jgi:prepilin-type N-terminal cleavage/methylation domain-containing protein
MKLTTRCRAFTIIELIMAMLISSVIIGIVYYVYIMFNHQFSNYREKANAIDEYLIFQKALQRDVESADAIKNPSANEIDCFTIADGRTVQYVFSNAFIVRSLQGAQDTFHIKNSGYEAEPVNDSTVLIKNLVLKMAVFDMPLRTTYTKIYSATQLMQQKPAYE